jgi:NADH-quinone oxidoreductase subunit N
MNFDPNHLLTALPEIYVLTLASLVLLIDLFLRDDQRILSYLLAQGGLVGALLLLFLLPGEGRQILFDGHYVRDAMADTLKMVMFIVTFGAFLYAKHDLKGRGLFKGEFYVLGLLALLGMMVMISAYSFLSIYLGLELLALCLYAMVAFDRDSRAASEAAMKYFVLGAMASGMLLYGISMLYGATGSLVFGKVAAGIAGADRLVLVFGLVFVVIGLAFKLGAVPFHMWVPDVYEGSPTATTLFIGSIPKIAAFALAMRLLVDGLGGLHLDWQGMLVILAVLSMAVGNLFALAQTNIKRMLAYSTISHVGFLVLGVLSGTAAGYSSSMFYAIVYALMALGGFGILVLLGRDGFSAEQIDDLKGLNQRSPWFAGMMLLLMFSMAGVPPTVGFFAKLFVLQAVVGIGMVWLALVAVFFSIIGAYYYIRIVKLMYFDKPETVAPLEAGWDTQLGLTVNGLAMLVLGLFPAGLLSLCQAAFA